MFSHTVVSTHKIILFFFLSYQSDIASNCEFMSCDFTLVVRQQATNTPRYRTLGPILLLILRRKALIKKILIPQIAKKIFCTYGFQYLFTYLQNFAS
jgi:hypothetical protein